LRKNLSKSRYWSPVDDEGKVVRSLELRFSTKGGSWVCFISQALTANQEVEHLITWCKWFLAREAVEGLFQCSRQTPLIQRSIKGWVMSANF